VPTKGVINTERFDLGMLFLYQLAVLYRHEHELDANVGLRAASAIMTKPRLAPQRIERTARYKSQSF